MLTNLLTKIAGPKVLLGVVIASTAAITFLTVQWQAALKAESIAEERAATYEAALARAETQLARAREQRRALNEAIAERRAREAEARRRAAAAESKLAELEDTNDEVSRWSNTPVPRDLRDWLREPGGGTIQEGR